MVLKQLAPLVSSCRLRTKRGARRQAASKPRGRTGTILSMIGRAPVPLGSLRLPALWSLMTLSGIPSADPISEDVEPTGRADLRYPTPLGRSRWNPNSALGMPRLAAVVRQSRDGRRVSPSNEIALAVRNYGFPPRRCGPPRRTARTLRQALRIARLSDDVARFLRRTGPDRSDVVRLGQ